MAVMEDTKNCKDHCPECGAGVEKIEFGAIDIADAVPYYPGKCLVCGCEFREIFTYAITYYKAKE